MNGEKDIYSFDEFVLDGNRRLLLRGTQVVVLNPKSLDLLIHLIQNRDAVVTKDELLERVWPDQIVEENNLSVQISALRKALGETKGEHSYIVTVPGRGYKFVADVAVPDGDELVIEQRTIERIMLEHDQMTGVPQLVGRATRRWPILAGTLVLVIAISGFAAYRFYAQKTPRVRSIAVLPFVNDSADPGNEYLSDGLAESVTYSLSQIKEMRVMSRGSTLRYKGRDTDAKTIGGELNVETILTGRVSQHGDTLSISAELVSTRDDAVLWGEQFSRKLTDIERLQSDIATSISRKLRFKLTGVEPRMTENAEAYRTYLEALFYWNKRTRENIEKSISLFKRAIELDPAFAQAYGGLAVAYEVQIANGAYTDAETDEIQTRTDEAIQKALEMDPDLAEVNAALGMRRFEVWDFTGAEASFKRAIEINPNSATVHQWYSEMLAAVGRMDEALAEIGRAYELDPYSRAVNMNLGLRYLASRRNDEAIAQFKKLIASEPDYPMAYIYLGTVYEDEGLLLESLEPACKADVLLGIDSADVCERENDELRSVYKTGGAAGFWKKSLEITQRLSKKGIVDDTWMAAAYFRNGDKDRGFDLLEKAFTQHSRYMVYLKMDPPFRDLGDDPRYLSLLKRIGLTP